MASDDQQDNGKRENQGPSDVRRRVTHHLRKLLIPGVMGLGACKNPDTPVVCDPMPPPVDGGAAAPPGNNPEDNAVEAGPGTPPQNEPPPVVCDPMPAPVPPPEPPKK